MNKLLTLSLLATSFMYAAWAQKSQEQSVAPSGSFKVWQLPSQGPTQMMSYVILSKNGKLLVIDGGRECDAPYLLDFIRARGDSVDLWFITHPHTDHVDALTTILKQSDAIPIRKICASLPDADWVRAHCDTGEITTCETFAAALAASGVPFESLALDHKMDVDGIHIHILGICNPELTKNPLNNSSVVLRMNDSEKSILFSGDLGYEGGEKLLNSPLGAFLPSEYVQMAHHGQNGTGESFYQKVNPRYCLWPTPKWLWDNDSGTGPGSGSFRTMEVRGWMDKLSIQKHYLMFEGLQVVE